MVRISIITYQFSVVVKSLEKSLIDQDFDVRLIEDDLDTVTESVEDTDAFIIYLQDSLLSDKNKIKNLLMICDMFEDKKIRPILIGSSTSKDAFCKAVPNLKDLPWFERPVDIVALIASVDKEIKRRTEDLDKKRVLIIDDDPIYGKMMCEWLSTRFNMDMVTDGVKAISWLAKNNADLILLDYEMPLINGPKVLEMLRSHPDTMDLPVIFLTGKGDKESVKKVLSLKPQGYILKSSTRGEIVKIILNYFQNK